MKKAEKDSRKQIASLEKDVERLEEIVQNKPDAPDYSDINHRTVSSIVVCRTCASVAYARELRRPRSVRSERRS